jgi:hypothetical protein
MDGFDILSGYLEREHRQAYRYAGIASRAIYIDSDAEERLV